MCILDTYNSVSRGRWEECIFVSDKEEVCLGFFEGVGKIVRLWMHDVFRQTKRAGKPLQWDVLTMRNVALLEGNFNLQDISVSGQNIPWSVDLQEICLLVFGILIKKKKR